MGTFLVALDEIAFQIRKPQVQNHEVDPGPLDICAKFYNDPYEDARYLIDRFRLKLDVTYVDFLSYACSQPLEAFGAHFCSSQVYCCPVWQQTIESSGYSSLLSTIVSYVLTKFETICKNCFCVYQLIAN